MRIESQGFAQVATGPVSKNLIRLFYMTDNVKKQTGVLDRNIKPLPVKQVGVLGAGTMGGGIAQLFADRGLKVRMKDLSNKALMLGLQEASRLWTNKLKRRRITKSEVQQRQNALSASLTYEGFGQMDVVVEAVVEDLSIKKAVFSQLSEKCHDQCLIATNTSSLSVTEMAQAYKKPENVVGMHFFNPVHRMPLVEIIRGEQSSDQAVTTVFQLAKKMGKTPLVVKDSPGFLVNRLLLPYLQEAVYLLDEGYPIGLIDEVYRHFGMPMGPLRLMDEVGIDVIVKVSQIFYQSFGQRAKPSALTARLYDSGLYGKKTKKGFYCYNDKGKEIGENTSLYKDFNLPTKDTLSEGVEQDILDRGLYAMVNEANRLLAEEVVASPEDVDLGMIMGTGFPPFRGGLLRFADQTGISHIQTRLEQFQGSYGQRFEPSPTLKEMTQAQDPCFYHLK